VTLSFHQARDLAHCRGASSGDEVEQLLDGWEKESARAREIGRGFSISVRIMLNFLLVDFFPISLCLIN
jgi:hypothetical protein